MENKLSFCVIIYNVMIIEQGNIGIPTLIQQSFFFFFDNLTSLDFRINEGLCHEPCLAEKISASGITSVFICHMYLNIFFLHPQMLVT